MLKMIIAVCLFGLLNNASAMDKVIYGEDNRLDVFQASSFNQLLAKSTAGMIAHYKITQNGEEATISGSSLESRGICKDESFAKQMTAANCSGFLIAKDILVTAGHCMKTQASCDGNAWVFDYGVFENGGGEKNITVKTSAVYKCAKIITQVLDAQNTKNDYAVIKLDRAVEGRAPLKFRTEGKIEDNTELTVIGHPSGLPSKVAGGANVRKNDNDTFFVANLDTFGGNSGSAVFDATSGVVEGILVRGETDYVLDSSDGQSCRRVKKCSNEECRGEDVTRITNIKELKDLSSL